MIRAVFDQEGELSDAFDLRRRFPGITDNAKGWHTSEDRRMEAAAASTVLGDPAASSRRESE